MVRTYLGYFVQLYDAMGYFADADLGHHLRNQTIAVEVDEPLAQMNPWRR